jgi:D-sedoheptulose 7-phosphate isomerase
MESRLNYIFEQTAQGLVTSMEALKTDPYFRKSFSVAAEQCVNTIKQGGKLLVAGNGGSAADAQHFAGELVSRFYFDRPALPAIALTTDTSIITAISNDYGYERVFSRQIEALGCSGDVVIAISTSGNSENILQAISSAKKKAIFTIGLTGLNGGKMKNLCDVCLCMPSDSTPRIQECHIVIEHVLCAFIEEAIFGAQRSV